MNAPTMKYRVEEAPNFTAKLRDKTVPEFSHVRFMCSVTGLPAPRITWQKDGKDITNNTNFFISVRSCLIRKNNWKFYETENLVKLCNFLSALVNKW